RWVDEHRVADGGGRDARPDGMHPAGVLVAEDDRQPQAGRLHQALDRVQVGRAHAGPAYADDDVAPSRRLRHGALDDLERPVVVREERGPHAAATWSASRVASAMIVSDGFTDSVRGISEASPTNRRFTSCDSPLRST